MGGTMPLIWGFAQRHSRAADWLDGQFGDSTHAQIARRAAAILVSRTRRSASSAMRSIVRCGAPQSRDTSAPSMIMGPVSAAHHRAQTRLWFCAASGARLFDNRVFGGSRHKGRGEVECAANVCANPAQPSCARQDARRRCSLQDARRGLRASRRLPYRWRVRWRREQPPSRP